MIKNGGNMTIKQISKIADFAVKAIIIFTTLCSILLFAGLYNQLVFSILGLVMLISLITKGIADTLIARGNQ